VSNIIYIAYDVKYLLHAGGETEPGMPVMRFKTLNLSCLIRAAI